MKFVLKTKHYFKNEGRKTCIEGARGEVRKKEIENRRREGGAETGSGVGEEAVGNVK